MTKSGRAARMLNFCLPLAALLLLQLPSKSIKHCWLLIQPNCITQRMAGISQQVRSVGRRSDDPSCSPDSFMRRGGKPLDEVAVWSSHLRHCNTGHDVATSRPTSCPSRPAAALAGSAGQQSASGPEMRNSPASYDFFIDTGGEVRRRSVPDGFAGRSKPNEINDLAILLLFHLPGRFSWYVLPKIHE